MVVFFFFFFSQERESRLSHVGRKYLYNLYLEQYGIVTKSTKSFVTFSKLKITLPVSMLLVLGVVYKLRLARAS